MKLNFNQIFSDKRSLKLLSLLAAFILWFIVANTVSESRTFVIEDVPVDFDGLSSSAMSRMGLEAVLTDDITVDVEVQGKRYIIGNLKPEDIKITPDVAKVQNSGIYPITLSGTDANALGFDVVGITPSSVSVRFDRFASKRLEIKSQISGISTTEGYLIENEIITPNEVVITGPESDIALVNSCVARADTDRVLRDSYSQNVALTLLDEDGNTIESNNLSMSVSSAQVTIPILKTKELPFTVDFTNIPHNFNADDLNFDFSKKSVKIAGPAAAIDKMEEFSLGYIDIRTLILGSVYDFDIELPSGFVNIENIETVQLEFDPEDYISVDFNLTEIQPTNVPAGYDVKIETLQLNNVEIVGPKDVMDKLSAGDLIVEVDVSEREVNVGEYILNAKIYSPNGLPVWASGKHEVIVLVERIED